LSFVSDLSIFKGAEAILKRELYTPESCLSRIHHFLKEFHMHVGMFISVVCVCVCTTGSRSASVGVVVVVNEDVVRTHSSVLHVCVCHRINGR